MKKLIALFLATLMVVSLCTVFAAADGETLVSVGKEYTISGNGKGYGNYTGNLTDNTALDAISYEAGKWFGFYYNKEYPVENAPDGVGFAVIDLGAKMDNLTTFKAHLFSGASGITPPQEACVYVSDDNTTFTKVGSFDAADLADHKSGDGTPLPYWVTLTLDKGVSARYVKFEFTIKSIFTFVDELEVYQGKASAPATTTTTIDLISMLGEGQKVDAEWSGTVGTIDYTIADGTLTATGNAVWPSVTFPFTEAITVDVAKTRLVLEATVENGDGCIRLLGADDGATSDDIYLHQFVEGATLSGGGDIVGPATISLDMPFADLAFCDYTAEAGYAGKITFTSETVDLSKLMIVSVSGATVKITKLQLVVTTDGGSTAPVKETITVDGELNDTGWNASKWTSVKPDESGTWQGTPPVGVTGTIEYKYQIRKDDTKLYIAVVYDGPAVKIANDKNSANGSGTNFRFWIHNGDPEATVYTHFVDACLREDGTTGSMMKINGSKDTNAAGSEILDSSLKAVVTEKDGKTYCELSIDLADLSIPEGKTASVIPTVSSVFVVHNEGADDTTANLCLFAGEFPAAEEGAGYSTNLPYHHWYGAQANSVTDDIALGEITAPQPDTGDSGIVALAILAIVALFGSAIVVKTRR